MLYQLTIIDPELSHDSYEEAFSIGLYPSREEAEAVAADILRLARDHGYRFRDIGILVREEDAYDRLLKLVLEDRHIPFFIDGTRETVHHPLAELVRSAFEAVRGWRYEPVFRCLRTGFFPLTNEQVDRLENYVLEFGIRGAKRWSMAEPWHWYRRRSLDNAEEDLLPREQQALAEIDAFRRQAALPLLHFAAALQAGSTVRDYTVAIYALLEELARRIERQKTFPHEIGLFLGYSPGDVAGFIEHRGQRFALSGYWKVYGDEAEARALFARYAACTEEFCGRLEAGQRFEDLVVAV